MRTAIAIGGIVLLGAFALLCYGAYRAYEAEEFLKLVDAAGRGDSIRVEALLWSGVNPNGVPHSSWSSKSYMAQVVDRPIMAAARDCHLDTIKTLLAFGADPNASCCATSALGISASRGHTECVRLLIENDANLEDEIETVDTYIAEARAKGHQEIAELLLTIQK